MLNSFKQAERAILKRLHDFMPRWIILLIDVAIVVLGYISLYLFRSTIVDTPIDLIEFKFPLLVILYTIAFIYFKTYHGIVRFSTMVDLKRLVYAAISATAAYEFVCIVGNTYASINEMEPIFNYWVPIVLAMVVISGQLMFRFVVRSVYESLEVNYKDKRERVFILGHDYESVLLTSSILAEPTNPYQPVAYIALRNGNAGKQVGGLPILDGRKGLKRLMEEYNVKKLLLFKSQLDTMPREFYDKCIVEGLELLMVNVFARHDESKGRTAPPQINKIKIEDLLGRNTIVMNREAIEDQFEGQNILITGAAGSIGSEIVRQVRQFNCNKIIMLDQAETPMNDLWLSMKAEKSDVEIVPIIASVTNESKMRYIFEKYRPSMVFHAAAYKHVPMMEFHPSTAVHTNVGGTKIVADLSVEYGVKRFVMISTDKAVNPTNVMGATKRAAEIYIQSLYYKLSDEGKKETTRFVTTRFGNVLGSNGSVVPLFKKQIEAGGPITVTHKDITRFFMTIPEACSLVLEAGCTGKGGEVYVFDMGEAVKIYDLAEKMIRLAGKVPNRDIMIVETGLRPGEKLYEELLSNSENTLPTYHKKVMIAKVRRYCYCDISSDIDDMLLVAQTYINPTEVVRRLKQLIPEFKSQNSKYELLDKELEDRNKSEVLEVRV